MDPVAICSLQGRARSALTLGSVGGRCIRPQNQGSTSQSLTRHSLLT